MSCLCEVNECVLCEAMLQTHLSNEQVCKIQGTLAINKYQKREILFREGDPSSHLFVLKSGIVKLSTFHPEGREQIIRLGLPFQLLGSCNLNNQTYSYTATAMSESVVCKIKQRDMLRVLDENPSVSLNVIKTLNEELQQSHALIRVLGRKTAVEKVALFILLLMPQDEVTTDMLHCPLTRQEIADVLGITEETVSRVMAELSREQIINAPRRNIHILDHARLKQLAGNEIVFHVGKKHL